jgi:hypothetical protein
VINVGKRKRDFEIINIKTKEILEYLLKDSNYTEACDSSTWYTSKEQARAYKKTHMTQKYNEVMHIPEIQLLEENKKDMVAFIKNISKGHEAINDLIQSYITYIDCGPGTADKTQIILDEMQRQKLNVNYAAIDVNEDFLENALKIVSPKVQKAAGYLGNFMNRYDFKKIISDATNTENSRFIYLGATFSNYKISEISKRFEDNKNMIYLSAQIVETEDDIKKTIEAYSNEKLYGEIGGNTLQNLHINKNEFKIKTEFNRETRCIEHIFEIKDKVSDERAKELTGKKIKVFESYKPTIKQFEEIMSDHYFFGKIYTNKEKTFAGFTGFKNKIYIT